MKSLIKVVGVSRYARLDEKLIISLNHQGRPVIHPFNTSWFEESVYFNGGDNIAVELSENTYLSTGHYENVDVRGIYVEMFFVGGVKIEDCIYFPDSPHKPFLPVSNLVRLPHSGIGVILKRIELINEFQDY